MPSTYYRFFSHPDCTVGSGIITGSAGLSAQFAGYTAGREFHPSPKKLQVAGAIICLSAGSVNPSPADNDGFRPHFPCPGKGRSLIFGAGMGIDQQGQVTAGIGFVFAGGEEAVVVGVSAVGHDHADQAGTVFCQGPGVGVRLETVFVDQLHNPGALFLADAGGSGENP